MEMKNAADEEGKGVHTPLLKNILSAGIAGTLHAMMEQPLVIPVEASITQSQVNGKSFSHNFRELYRQGALYRSLPTALLGSAPKSVVHYSLLAVYSTEFAPSGDLQQASGAQATLIGMSVGASEVILTNPLNFVKFRMQRPEWGYTGMGDAVRTIAAREGVSAFWKGTGYVFMRNSVCNGGMVGGFRVFDGLLLGVEWFGERENIRHFLAGSLGGLFGSLISYPFEMLRAAKQHNISFHAEIYSKGPRRLMAGWLPGALRLILTSSIMGSLIPRLRGWSDRIVGED